MLLLLLLLPPRGMLMADHTKSWGLISTTYVDFHRI
jgi:hypothetical protein